MDRPETTPSPPDKASIARGRSALAALRKIIKQPPGVAVAPQIDVRNAVCSGSLSIAPVFKECSEPGKDANFANSSPFHGNSVIASHSTTMGGPSRKCCNVPLLVVASNNQSDQTIRAGLNGIFAIPLATTRGFDASGASEKGRTSEICKAQTIACHGKSDEGHRSVETTALSELDCNVELTPMSKDLKRDVSQNLGIVQRWQVSMASSSLVRSDSIGNAGVTENRLVNTSSTESAYNSSRGDSSSDTSNSSSEASDSSSDCESDDSSLDEPCSTKDRPEKKLDHLAPVSERDTDMTQTPVVADSHTDQTHMLKQMGEGRSNGSFGPALPRLANNSVALTKAVPVASMVVMPVHCTQIIPSPLGETQEVDAKIGECKGLLTDIAKILKNRDLNKFTLRSLRSELEKARGLKPGSLDPQREDIALLAEVVVRQLPSVQLQKRRQLPSSVKGTASIGSRCASKRVIAELDGCDEVDRAKEVPPSVVQTSKEKFLKLASPLVLDIHGTRWSVPAKVSSDGLCGFYRVVDASLDLNGQKLSMCCKVNCGIQGSRHWTPD